MVGSASEIVYSSRSIIAEAIDALENEKLSL
jgi:hypothetical protein